MNALPDPIEWVDDRVRIVDQRRLPGEVVFCDCTSVEQLADAIASLAIRGAPAIGLAGAYGVALAARLDPRPESVRSAARCLVATRPTAVNLAWGVTRALEAFERDGAEAALRVARELAEADVATNRQLGRRGSDWLLEQFGQQRLRVLTHCNAGHFATAGYGTAVGVIRAHFERGLVEAVWVDETRPLLQGARLTAWELERLGISHAVIVDSAAASFMAAGLVDVVVVGADRIAANGDVANKVGTYGLAVLARYHDIPFVVVAPASTLDAATSEGSEIEVEDRPRTEIAEFAGLVVVGEGSPVRNPAFDVTPAALVTRLITDAGG